MRTIQYFTDEYLEQCRSLTATEIVEFLEDVRLFSEALSLSAGMDNTTVIRKVPIDLLNVFKAKFQMSSSAYEIKFKELLREYLD